MEQKKEKEPQSSVDLEELPEGCVATILSFTTPRDACRSAIVSKTFRSASNSDAVWDKLLPQDLQSIISRCSAPPPQFSSKKELFFSLCDNPILIDDSRKSFSLEKRSGKKCYMLAARDLMIAWGDTPRYWEWINLPDSRFLEVAHLKLVWWLHIRGWINTSMLSTATSYAAYLVFKVLQDGSYRLDYYPTEVSIGIVGGEMLATRVWLLPDDEEQSLQRRLPELKRPTRRGDGWLEIEVGEYFNHHGEDGELEMSVKEVNVNASKSGLIVQGIEIRPKI